MTRHRAALLVLAGTVALAACSSSSSSPDEPSSTSSTSTSTAAPATPTPDAETACGLYANGPDRETLMWRVPEAINGLSSNATQAEVDAMLEVHDDLEQAADHAPTELAAALRALDEPFADFADHVDNGGGSINLDTSMIATNATDVLTLCADSGFKVSDTVPSVE